MTTPLGLCRSCGHPNRAQRNIERCQCDERELVLVVPTPAAAAIRSYLRKRPELLKDQYDHAADENPLLGLCYPAAESFYHVAGCEPEVYCLSWSAVDADLDGTHWFLREPDGERRWIDLALPLDEGVTLPPFEQGTHRGFITGDEPSQRAQQVLDYLGVSEGGEER